MQDCLISLGANLGDRNATLQAAVGRLSRHPAINVQNVSRWYASQPAGGPPDQPDFINGVARLATSLSCRDLLAVLQRVEGLLGRNRTERWAARAIDLDLLLYGDLELDEPDLMVPHPRMVARRFVLEPACEVASEMVHAPTGLTVEQLADRLKQTPKYFALAGFDRATASRLARQVAGQLSIVVVDDASDASDSPLDVPPRSAPLETLRTLSSRLAGISTESPRISTFWVAEPLLRAIMEGAGPEREAMRQGLLALPKWMRGTLLFTPGLRPNWPDLLTGQAATAASWEKAWRQVDRDLGPVPQVPVGSDAVQEIAACIQSAIVPCHPI